jgi:hypothetical protein
VKEDIAERIFSDPRIDVILDSGAFTAKNAGFSIELSEYMEFLQRWGSKTFGYVALDVLQDPVATDRNLQVMLDAGLTPFPVHVFGDEQERMDQLFEWSPRLVFLGGLRRPHRGSAPVTYVKKKMEWANGRPVHWLGYPTESHLRAFRPYSCDCSSWVRGPRYGEIDAYLGRGRWLNFKRPQRASTVMTPELETVLENCGFTASDFYDGELWSRRGIPRERLLTLQIGVDSWVRYILEFQRTWGVRIFLALMPDADSTFVFKCLDRYDPQEFQESCVIPS